MSIQNRSRGRGRSVYSSRTAASRRNSGGNRNKQHIDPSRFVKKATAAAEANYTADNAFADFALHADLKSAVNARGFIEPTPIQDRAIPAALEGRDVIGVANTGTGKTAAFLLPTMHSLLHNQNQQALVIAPTRELALQIQDEFRQYATNVKLYSTLCIGGTSIGKQIQQLRRKPHIVIGTPGRLKDLLTRRALDVSRSHTLILDEVDRMVDMGFIKDIQHIVGHLPKIRQSLFFTATINPGVERVMQQFVSNPHVINLKTSPTADNIEQNVVRAGAGMQKIETLHQLLNQPEFGKVLVFGETKRGVERLAQDLEKRGIKAVSIHGNKTQAQRQRALSQFRRDDVRVMVATDVAARGLDISDISHVVNFDIPQTYDDYIHRIGRAGRAGKVGNALTFV